MLHSFPMMAGRAPQADGAIPPLRRMGGAEAGPSRRRNEGSSMRKLIVSSFVSLDGVIESPMTWTSPFFDNESKEYAARRCRILSPRPLDVRRLLGALASDQR